MAAKGWPVFPCHPGTRDGAGKSKYPLTDNGFEGATADVGQIRAWWRTTPDALIGLEPGRIGAFVVDLDPKEDETPADVVTRLEEELGITLPLTPRSVTQSGGWHLWFRKPDGISLGNRKPIKGVDFRCERGYVIVPPSRMRNGNTYTWDGPAGDWFDPLDDVLPALPPELLKAAEKKQAPEVLPSGPVTQRKFGTLDPGEENVRKYVRAALENACAEMASTGPGGRGSTLNSLAYSLGKYVAAGGLSEREVWADLSEAADQSGLTQTDGVAERDAKIRRGIEAGKANVGEAHATLDRIRNEGIGRAERYAAGGRPPQPPPPGESGPDAGIGHNGPPGPPDNPPDSPAPTPQPLDPLVIKACALEPVNDTGNGRRLLHWFGADTLHVTNVGWHIWSTRHWEYDPPANGRDSIGIMTTALCQQISERIGLESRFIEPSKAETAAIEAGKIAMETADGDRTPAQRALITDMGKAQQAVQNRKSARRKFGVSSGNAERVKKTAQMAIPHCAKRPEDMDKNGLLFNVENGTLVFSKVRDDECPDPDVIRLVGHVELKSHDRADLISKVAPVVYDPEATCPKWREFLETSQPNPNIRRFLQVFHGVGLLGIAVQAVVLNYGTGANGKSTFSEALMRLVGSYGSILNAESISGQNQARGDQASPDLAKLQGVRLLQIAELPRGEPLKESLIKSLTGGEKRPVRHLHQGFFDLIPVFSPSMSANEKPQIQGQDIGIWRRVHLVNWDQLIAEGSRREFEEIQAEFRAERSGILNWLIEGALSFLSDGLQAPPEVRAATDEYRKEMDPLQSFLSACVKEEPDSKVQASSMYEAYTAWCTANSVKPVTSTKFGRVMNTKGYQREDGRVRFWLNVKLHNVPYPEPPS